MGQNRFSVMRTSKLLYVVFWIMIHIEGRTMYAM